MTTVRASVIWDYAMRAAVPVVIAASGMAIRAELKLNSHDKDIAALRQAEDDRRMLDRESMQLDRQMLAELSAIRVAIARLEERAAK